MSDFLKDMYRTFILHAVASHFINGLLPVAVLFLLLGLATGNTYYEHTVVHLVAVALCAIPVSFVSGIRDWRIKFKRGKAPVFYRKIALSLTLLTLCLIALGIRLSRPGLADGGGTVAWLYRGCLIGMLPVVVLLGHFGAKLASQVRQANDHSRAN
jgi:formate hydrogenlyase subunit 3/multisubunit Na+/H+ antiporter MnhD subunit